MTDMHCKGKILQVPNLFQRKQMQNTWKARKPGHHQRYRNHSHPAKGWHMVSHESCFQMHFGTLQQPKHAANQQVQLDKCTCMHHEVSDPYSRARTCRSPGLLSAPGLQEETIHCLLTSNLGHLAMCLTRGGHSTHTHTELQPHSHQGKWQIHMPSQQRMNNHKTSQVKIKCVHKVSDLHNSAS